MTFYCKSGHAFDFQELLSAQSELATGALEKLLAEWELQEQFLNRCAEDARRNGYTDIADLFVRRAERLERKVESLRTVRKDDSSKLVAVPWVPAKTRLLGSRRES